MKRIISLLLVSAMCLSLIAVSAVSAFADTTKINISRVNSYTEGNTTDIVAWASNSPDATVQSIFESPDTTDFIWFYFILLQYNSANGSYTVIDLSGFDENGNDTRADDTYNTWTLGSNKVAVMARRQASDTDGYNLLRASSVGDTFYLNTTFNSLANTYSAVSDVYFSTEPISGSNPGGGNDDDNDTAEGENVLDIAITTPEYYESGEEFTVNVYVNNITAKNGVSLVKFDLTYDKDKFELTNEVDADNYNELLCVSALPNASWENLSYAKNGAVAVQALTAEIDSSNFATEDEEIAFEFKFKAKEDASGDSVFSVDNVIAAQNTADGATKFVGNGEGVTIMQSPYVFDVVFKAPKSCNAGEEISITAEVCNITAKDGVSLIKFEIKYDQTKFVLTNESTEDGELMFESSIPNVLWENLSYATNGVVYIQLLTAQVDPSNFAIYDGDIAISLNFKALDDASGEGLFTISNDSIVGGVNTEDDATVVYGRGDSISVTVNEPVIVPEYTLGDIDNDGELTTSDYIYVKRAYMGTYSLSDVQFLAADIDKDGEITTSDYIYVKRAYMGTYVIG